MWLAGRVRPLPSNQADRTGPDLHVVRRQSHVLVDRTGVDDGQGYAPTGHHDDVHGEDGEVVLVPREEHYVQYVEAVLSPSNLAGGRRGSAGRIGRWDGDGAFK